MAHAFSIFEHIKRITHISFSYFTLNTNSVSCVLIRGWRLKGGNLSKIYSYKKNFTAPFEIINNFNYDKLSSEFQKWCLLSFLPTCCINTLTKLRLNDAPISNKLTFWDARCVTHFDLNVKRRGTSSEGGAPWHHPW